MVWLRFKDADPPQAVYGNIFETLKEDGKFNLRHTGLEIFLSIRDVNDNIMY